MKAAIETSRNACITIYTLPTAAKNPADLLWELLINADHYQMPPLLLIPSLLPSFLSFPFLPSPLLHRTFFSQTVISVETLSPGQTFPHARAHTHTHTNACPPPSTPCQMSTPRPHLCGSFHGSASLHPETLSRLPSRTCRGKALDGTVSLPASEERGSIISPLLLNLCSGQVWTPKWTRCMNSTHPHLPRKADFFFFNRARIQNASKMCASCFSLKFDETTPARIWKLTVAFLAFLHQTGQGGGSIPAWAEKKAPTFSPIRCYTCPEFIPTSTNTSFLHALSLLRGDGLCMLDHIRSQQLSCLFQWIQVPCGPLLRKHAYLGFCVNFRKVLVLV